MNLLTKIIWKFEPRAILLPYRSGNANLTKDSEPFKSRTQIQLYCDNAFIKLNANTWMKLFLAHDKPKSDYEDDELFQGSIQEADLWFHLDKIQAKSASSIGWLLGSTPDSCNINDMKLAHQSHPGLGIECEPRTQAIRLYPGKNNIPVAQQVKAVHIYVATSNVTPARRLYNRVFGSSNAGGYPMGQVLRFVPDISDPRHLASMQTRAKVIRMMSKQKHLLASSVNIPTSTIAGLHVYNEEVGHTLCEILMNLRLGEDLDIPLFLSVEERLWGAAGYQVIFTVRKDRINEANSVIPLLCVIIEAKFGASSRQWFTEEARLTSEGFYWDEAEQQVKQLEDPTNADDDDFSIASNDSYVANLTAVLNLGDLKDIEGGSVLNFDLDFVFNDSAPPNQYGDQGSVKTFRDICEPKSHQGAAAPDKSPTSTVSAATSLKTATPDTLSGTNIDTANNTQVTQDSTITDPANTGSMEQMMANHPDLVRQFLSNNPQLFQPQQPASNSTASPTDTGVGGRL
jgi:hypothetical protein